MTDYSLMGVIGVTITCFLKFCPNYIYGIGEATHFKFCLLFVCRSTSARVIYYP